MPTPPLSDELAQQAVDALAACGGNVTHAAQKLGIGRPAMQGRLMVAKQRGMLPGAKKPAPVAPVEIDHGQAILAALKKAPATLADLAAAIGLTKGQALDEIEDLQIDGNAITLAGDRYKLGGVINPAFMRAGDLPTYISRPDGTYLFGATGDNHIASKYARLDVLNELYDIYAQEGVERVYNTGNWIDGEASFNQHDLLVHGMDGQIRALVRDYPQRAGIVTHAVAGDDHEGWYGQKFGVDIGRRAEQAMRDAGRTDWHDLGFMEAHIRLVHSQSGAEAILAVVHPGGGSAYATSYAIQKIIESLDGGEKPAVGLYGHYHKLWGGNIRNVWCIQTGTTQDQTPFMRKRKLEAHVGGTLVKLHQDPKTGAITRCNFELMRWFNKGFYNNRWNHGGDVVHAERSP